MLPPSIYAHILNGLLLFGSLCFAIFNIRKLMTLDFYKMSILILIGSIAVGVHGLSHLLLEKEYRYIPFNLWVLPKKNSPK
jgi:hypothetical protein